MSTNSSKMKKAISLLLTLTLVLNTLPPNFLPTTSQVVQAAPNTSNDALEYKRVDAPEVAIFNAFTGQDDAFYQSVMGSSNYNAVEAGYFGTLRYSTKVTGTAEYSWSSFSGSTINSLRKNNSDIQMGYSVTRTSNPHSHTAYLVVRYEMTSYSNTSLGFGLGGLALSGVFNYSGYNKSQDTYRAGNKKFKTYVPQDGKSLDLAFNVSPIKYNDNNNTCGCGGTSEGCMVCFYDGNRPYITQLYIRNSSDNYCDNFKPGDSVNIVLTCSEPIRFADDSASGKGNVYIGLKLNGSTNMLYAHLTKLNGNQLTFTYNAPADLKTIYDIAAIDLTKAPQGGTALLNSDAVVPLKQLKKSGAFTATKPENSGEQGITKTTSPVTDIAGNALYLNSGDATNIARSFNIDGEKPRAVEVDIVADTKNADIKELLDKTKLPPDDKNYRDGSDNYLGVGDTLLLKVYMNEVVKMPGSATLTTNIKKKDGTYLTFTATPTYNISATSANLGSQYGLGASKGEVSVLQTHSKTIEKGMTIDDPEGIIKITKIVYSDMKDLAGNVANDTSEPPSPKQHYQIDTDAPTAEVDNVTGANKTEYGFCVPFKVTDNTKGSDVQKLPATLKLGSGGSTGKFMYAVTSNGDTPKDKDWNEGQEGLSLPFTQSGGTQYLHVKKISGENYDMRELSFFLSDYAGNMAETTKVTVTGVGFDSVGPVIIAGKSSTSYNNSTNSGTLTAEIVSKDPSGVASVQYLWNDGTEVTEKSGGWIDATGTTGETSISVNATAEVASHTSFTQTLWIKATDAVGNVSVLSLGEYTYSLTGINYDIEFPAGVVTEPSLNVKSIEGGGALVFDVQKPGDSTHYISVYNDVDPSSTDTNIFSLSQKWFAATLVNDNGGIKYTDLTEANKFVFYQGDDHFTGNVSVKVYSGTCNRSDNVQSADISRSSWGSSSTEDIIITTNAEAKEIILKVSWAHNYNGRDEVFSKFDFSVSPDIASVGKLSGPWEYNENSQYCLAYHISTLEGVQVSFDLGEDVNGWDFADIDWENSYISLEDETTKEKIKVCGIGYGPKQTITLPAIDVETGKYRIRLYLHRHSSDWSYYYNSKQIFIDTTEPGNMKLEMLAKRSSEGTWKAEDTTTAPYESLAFDPNKTIYLPTQQCNTFLSVDVLDPDGVTPHEMKNIEDYLSVGETTIIAWNTAHPEQKITLQRACLVTDETTGKISFHELEETDTSSKRLLYFGITAEHGTDATRYSLGLEPDQDNVIAIQVRYSNGKASDITYLTIHPVSIALEGITTTLPVRMSNWATWLPEPQPLDEDWTGIQTADPEKATVVFTPGDEYAGLLATSGVRLYCRLGEEVGALYANKSTLSNRSYAYYTVFEWDESSEPREMIAQGDGSYTVTVPVYDKSVKDVLDTFKSDGKFKEIYCIYAEDIYGNRVDVSYAPVWIVADAKAPVISNAKVTADANGKFTATYQVYDDSLYSFGGLFDNKGTYVNAPPITLELSYNNEYAQAIGAFGEGLILTADLTKGDYVWTATDSTSMGIRKVTASLVREDPVKINYYGFECPTDVYLTVTVEGYVSPKISSATDMTLNLKATDGHDNACDAVGATASVTGVTPAVIDKQYKILDSAYSWATNRALFLTFNVPVQPKESWINRNIEGFDTEWHDAFPIWKDGTWDITFTDVFGTEYTQSLVLEDVIGKYGFELAFSTLDYVAASEGVTISYMPDDGDEKVTHNLFPDSYTFNENGLYYIAREGDGGYDSLPIYLNNIISGGPEEKLFFYIDEFKEQYEAGSEGQFRGTTSGPVTVSYRTSRETSPVGDTTLTFKDGDNDTFTFKYYDAATAFTYTITGKLSDYGITITTPPAPYADVDAPSIDLVGIWKQQGGGFVQAEAFPGGADESTVKSAIARTGAAQGFDFVVNASDYSKWKVVVKSAAPTSMSYASATSDTIPGVSVSGNNVLITEDIASDFYIVVVDNAKTDSAATADNFSYVKVPNGSYQFDTIAPEIVTTTVADNLYSRTVYIKATDNDNAGNDTGKNVTITGANVIANTDANAAEYPYKLLFTNNSTVVTVTATDAAGNSASVNLQVSGIDATAPILAVTWSPCFQDPVTGKLDRSNPTIGPVNTDVVAHITSDKDIMEVTATYTSYWGGTVEYDFNNPYQYWWGYIDYTSQRVSVHFYDSDSHDFVVNLNVKAPNGQITPITLTLKGGVIDKYEPYIILDDVKELKRDGYSVPYALSLLIRPTEEAYCTNYGPLGKLYYDDADDPHLLTVTLTDYDPQIFYFVDKAGNQGKLEITKDFFEYMFPHFDSVAPTIQVDVPDNANATNSAVPVTVTANEKCSLSCYDGSVTCGTMTLQGTDSEGNEIWAGVVNASANGTFRVYATDEAGNTTSALFTVHNVDKTMPIIRFDPTTVKLRQDSEASALTKLLGDGVTTWDNVAIQADTLAYDASGVLLDTVGIYSVTYTVSDSAGNVGEAVRYVKIIDKNQPIISIDGILTEDNGTTSVNVGSHALSVSGLRTENEPYTLKLVKGIWSSGQMKRASSDIPVGEDGSFTVDTEGFYTVYIVTQSRQTYRTLLYVEN
ncbi:MAG: hypothetical protein IKX10_00395 [Lachnospiraceae bacterium]|nr:hypothetical protein [Lachnospiraceae bacterium]